MARCREAGSDTRYSPVEKPRKPPSPSESTGRKRPFTATGASTFIPTSVTVGSSARRARSCTCVAGVLGQLRPQFLAHLVAEAVDDEERGDARLLC